MITGNIDTYRCQIDSQHVKSSSLVHGPGAVVQVGAAHAGLYAQRPGSESPGHQCEDLFVLKIFYVGTICNATDITNNNYDHNYNLFLKLTQEFQCLQQIQQQTTPAHGFTLARNIQPTPSSK